MLSARDKSWTIGLPSGPCIQILADSKLRPVFFQVCHSRIMFMIIISILSKCTSPFRWWGPLCLKSKSWHRHDVAALFLHEIWMSALKSLIWASINLITLNQCTFFILFVEHIWFCIIILQIKAWIASITRNCYGAAQPPLKLGSWIQIIPNFYLLFFHIRWRLWIRLTPCKGWTDLAVSTGTWTKIELFIEWSFISVIRIVIG